MATRPPPRRIAQGTRQRIIPCLWFDHQAEAAARFYTSLFPRSRVTRIVRSTEAGPGPAGSVLLVALRIHGFEVLALNGGPAYTFTPAISLVASCSNQREIDRLWSRLAAGGMTHRCGWLEDRFGVSWQVVPAELPSLIQRGDAMQAMLGMDKLELATLRRAAKARVEGEARRSRPLQGKKSQQVVSISTGRS